MKIRDHYFGKVDGEDDFVNNPDFFERAFVDNGDATKGIQEGQYWYVIGRKGTGKTAIASHVERLGKSNSYAAFTRNYRELWSARARIKANKELDDSLAQIVYWRVLLLLEAWTLVALQQERMLNDAAVKTLTKRLIGSGLLYTSDTLWRLVERSIERGGGINLQLVQGEGKVQETSAIQSPETIAQILQDALLIRASGVVERTILFIDGTDYFLNDDDPPWHHVRALISATRDLNMCALRNKCPITFVVLCRTEVFTGLNDTDLNKLRQDRTIALNWYRTPRDPLSSDLMKVWVKRAQASNPQLVGNDRCWYSLFPDTVDGRDSWDYVKNNTLLRPRDLVALMMWSRLGSGELEKLDREHTLQTLWLYSEGYLLGELDNSITGFLTSDKKRGVRELFQRLGPSEFSSTHWMSCARNVSRIGNDDDLSILRLLFDHGYIMMIDPAGKVSTRFYDEHIELVDSYQFRVHTGIRRALNLL